MSTINFKITFLFSFICIFFSCNSINEANIYRKSFKKKIKINHSRSKDSLKKYAKIYGYIYSSSISYKFKPYKEKKVESLFFNLADTVYVKEYYVFQSIRGESVNYTNVLFDNTQMYYDSSRSGNERVLYKTDKIDSALINFSNDFKKDKIKLNKNKNVEYDRESFGFAVIINGKVNVILSKNADGTYNQIYKKKPTHYYQN